MNSTTKTSPTRRPQRAFESSLHDHLSGSKTQGVPVPGVQGVRHGLDLSALDALRERLGLGQESLERILDISTRTLQRRRRDDQRLSPAESDRLWRILHILDRAIQAFGGDEASARAWLLAPSSLLGYESPLEHLDTEPGLREVEDMLTVIDETGAA